MNRLLKMTTSDFRVRLGAENWWVSKALAVQAVKLLI